MGVFVAVGVIVAVGVFVAVLVGGKGAFASTLGCTHPKRIIIAMILRKMIFFSFINLPLSGCVFLLVIRQKDCSRKHFSESKTLELGLKTCKLLKHKVSSPR